MPTDSKPVKPVPLNWPASASAKQLPALPSKQPPGAVRLPDLAPAPGGTSLPRQGPPPADLAVPSVMNWPGQRSIQAEALRWPKYEMTAQRLAEWPALKSEAPQAIKWPGSAPVAAGGDSGGLARGSSASLVSSSPLSWPGSKAEKPQALSWPDARPPAPLASSAGAGQFPALPSLSPLPELPGRQEQPPVAALVEAVQGLVAALKARPDVGAVPVAMPPRARTKVGFPWSR